MHEGGAQQAVAQMPQIMCPEGLNPIVIRQPSLDGIDLEAYAA